MKKLLFLCLCMLSLYTTALADNNVGIFIGYNSINDIADDDEKAAAEWFQQNYPQGVVYTPSTIGTLSKDKVNLLWVMIDRVGLQQGWQQLPQEFISDNALKALKAYAQAGGNLLLTKHATQLTVAIGRLSDNYKPTIFGNGEGSDIDETWGSNANIGSDHSSHALYKGLSTAITSQGGDHSYFPMLGPGFREDHNCMWDFPTCGFGSPYVNDFQNATSSTVIGTWQQVVDNICGGIIEFNPTRQFPGHEIAIGLGAYEWKQNNGTNPYQSNIEKMTKNAIDYLKELQPETFPDLPDVDKATVAFFDMTLSGSSVTEAVTGNTCNVNHVLAPQVKKGAVGDAIRFDGYSNFINANIDINQLSQDQVSFDMWCAPQTYPVFNPDGAPNSWTTLAGNIAGNNGLAFEISAQGYYRISCAVDGQVKQITSSKPMPVYEWNHLVATIDCRSNSMKFYNNGTLIGETSIGNSINKGGSAFIIGKSTENLTGAGYQLNTFNGLIDDVTLRNGIVDDDVINAQPENKADLLYPDSRYANDICRPAFHGMPNANWTNETHGFCYYNGKYHLFFQQNANGPYWGHLHWGHLVSTDLYNWTEEKPALTPAESYDTKGCWSGTVFADDEFTGGKPYIFYTGVDAAKARIAYATPLDDDLLNWEKKGVIVDGKPAGLGDDFRDPNVFKSNGKLYMMVGSKSSNGLGTATLHRYNNGSWSSDESRFFTGTDKATDGTFWEMPNVTNIGGKWLFTATPQGQANGVQLIYYVGSINNDGTFNPYFSKAKPFDVEGTSYDGYGLMSPSFMQHDGKTVIVGIVADKLGTADNVRLGYAHTYCLPREVSIDADNNVVQKPYSGLTKMRSTTKFEKANFSLSGTQSLAPVSGRAAEILGEFTVGNAAFGYNFFKSGDRQARLIFTPGTNKVTVDLRNLDRTVDVGKYKDGLYEGTLPKRINSGETLKLNLFIDHSIIDIFINDTWAFSVRVFPTNANATAIEAFSEGNTAVKKLQAWVLDKRCGTGIDNAFTTVNEKAAKTDVVYDLQGRRMADNSSLSRGIYIKNGKKFIVR